MSRSRLLRAGGVVLLVGAFAWAGYTRWQTSRQQALHQQIVGPATTTAPVRAARTLVAPDLPVTADAPRFVNVTEVAGVDYVQNVAPLRDLRNSEQTGGAGTADYDGDGWLDLLVTRLDAPPILYRNLGPDAEGIVRFADVTAAAGLDKPSHGTSGVLWADFDNDRDPDLFLTTSYQYTYFLFINQGNGTFTEEAADRGVDFLTTAVEHYGHSAAAGDYDADGYLDLAIGEWGQPARHEFIGFRLLRNRGAEKPGHFIDVTESTGVLDFEPGSYNNEVARPMDWAFTPRFTDLDQDGLIDLAITVDNYNSRLFWNNGDGSFTDGTSHAATGSGTSEMGATIADYDGDGRLDWFVTGIYLPGSDIPDHGNRLYRNEGDRTFSDRAIDAGVDNVGWGWGTAFFDYDNDTDFDLIATGGYLDALGYDDDPTRLWRNNGEGGYKTTFSDIGADSGIADTGQGRGIVTFDYDNDGDLDVFISKFGEKGILYRNDGGHRGHWLRLRLTGTTSNRDGANALVTVSDPRLKWPLIWEHSMGSNFLSQSEPCVHFGLGQIADKVESVTIRWPSGTVQTLGDVAVNQVLAVEEPARPSDFAMTEPAALTKYPEMNTH